jgi:hypothetical protein
MKKEICMVRFRIQEVYALQWGHQRRKCFRFKRYQVQGLENWISKVRVKRNALERCGRENLRLEAILSNALAKAETQLQVKQCQRFQRVKAKVCKTFD